jgi:ankyrin repeat protein
VINQLLEIGKMDANLKNKDGRLLLSLAVQNGCEAVAKLLLDTGKVDAALEDNDGRTPLSWVAQNRHVALVKMLLDTGRANPESEGQERSDTAIMDCWRHDTIVV